MAARIAQAELQGENYVGSKRELLSRRRHTSRTLLHFRSADTSQHGLAVLQGVRRRRFAEVAWRRHAAGAPTCCRFLLRFSLTTAPNPFVQAIFKQNRWPMNVVMTGRETTKKEPAAALLPKRCGSTIQASQTNERARSWRNRWTRGCRTSGWETCICSVRARRRSATRNGRFAAR